jgi:hypothetical protein
MSDVEDTSLNVKELRSGKLLIAKTVPKVSAKPKQIKLSEIEIQKVEKTVAPLIQNKMAEGKDTEKMISADDNWEQFDKTHKQHDEEIYRLKQDMQKRYDNEMISQSYEQSRLKDALHGATKELQERDQLIAEMAHAMEMAKRSTSPTRKSVSDTDDELKMSSKSPTTAGVTTAAATTTAVATDRVRSSPSSISDRIIAPELFTARANTDAESWLESFERYCEYKQYGPEDRLTLLPLLMRETASDWISTLSKETFHSYDSLREAFKRNYFSPAELAWQLQGNLWRESQRSDEKVDEFISRVRKRARRLNLESTAITDIIINGLRPSIRMHVLLQKASGVGPTTLEDLVKFSRLAEAVAVQQPDTSTNLLVEVMKASAATNELQARELRELTNKVAALTMVQDNQQVNATRGGAEAPTQRTYKYSPQREQRNNWHRSAKTSDDSQSTDKVNAKPACGRCGYPAHAQGRRCPAMQEGTTCNNCGKVNHFARVCRSGQRPQNDNKQ